MKDKSAARFLAQFEVSKKNVADWPDWMRNAAKVATASFPESRASKATDKEMAGIKRKK
jgi:hypothetical protein